MFVDKVQYMNMWYVCIKSAKYCVAGHSVDRAPCIWLTFWSPSSKFPSGLKALKSDAVVVSINYRLNLSLGKIMLKMAIFRIVGKFAWRSKDWWVSSLKLSQFWGLAFCSLQWQRWSPPIEAVGAFTTVTIPMFVSILWEVIDINNRKKESLSSSNWLLELHICRFQRSNCCSSVGPAEYC